MSTIGVRIRNLRKVKDITQDQLANLIHVNRATLANWEIDRATPDPNTLQLLADHFGVSVDYLLGRMDKTQPEYFTRLEQQWPEGTKVLLRAHNKLTPEKKRKMLRLIETYINEDDDDDED